MDKTSKRTFRKVERQLGLGGIRRVVVRSAYSSNSEICLNGVSARPGDWCEYLEQRDREISRDQSLISVGVGGVLGVVGTLGGVILGWLLTAG